jgi:TRAP-type transport system small permease protein
VSKDTLVNVIRKILDKIIEIFCMSTLALMTVMITWQVTTRYVFNRPSVRTEQTSQYLFVWLVLYGAAYVFGQKEHMQITFLKDKASVAVQKILTMLGEILIAIFAGSVMIYGGYLSASGQMTQKDAALGIPMGVIYSAIPISGLFILFYAVGNILLLLKRLDNK